MATYKAYAITAAKEDLQLQLRDLQSTLKKVPPEGVLLQVHAVGVCHSDVHYWRGCYQIGKSEKEMLKFSERPGMSYPKVPGHEIAGTVYAMGSVAKEKSTLNSGERVIVYAMAGCCACSVCESGDVNLCNVKCQDVGLVVDGGFSEYVVIPHYMLVVKVPDTIAIEVAALLACSGLTAYSSIKKCLPVVQRVKSWKEDLSVLVIGLGGLGQWALQLLSHCLGQDIKYRVTGVDINNKKLEMAQKQGLVDATFVYNASEPPTQQAERFIAQIGGKPNVILDFVNTTSTFSFSIESLHKSGALILVGLNGGLGELKLPLTVLGMYTVVGSYFGKLDELKELLTLVGKQSIPSPPLSRYPLDDASKVIRELDQGKIMGRAVLDVISATCSNNY